MPEVHELPPHVHTQVRASRGEADPTASAPEHKRMTLLQRLATVGFGGGRKEETAQPSMPAEAPPLPMPMPAPAPEAAQRPAPSPAHAEYAKRPAPQGYRPAQGSLDAHGRAAPPQRSIEDEQLEIPAFLRRQAN
jgi:cell division protein FtsZ